MERRLLFLDFNSNFTVNAESFISFDSDIHSTKIEVLGKSILSAKPSPTTARPTLASGPTSVQYLFLTMANSSLVEFWKLPKKINMVKLRMSEGNLSNCDFQASSEITIEGDTTSFISYDATDEISMTLDGTNMNFFGDSKLVLKNSAPIAFQATLSPVFVFSGYVLALGTVSSHCELEMASLVAFAPGSSLTSGCDLRLRGGTIANTSSTIKGSDKMQRRLLFGPPLSRAQDWPKFGGRFELDDFTSIEIDLISALTAQNPLNNNSMAFISQFASNTTTLEMVYKPTTGIRVVWPSYLPPPTPGRRYRLFTRSAVSELGEPSETSLFDPEVDSYQFKIDHDLIGSQTYDVWATWIPFVCSDIGSRNCITNHSIDQPTLVLPNAGVVIINGNLTTGSITYTGLTTVIVRGCIASNLTLITIELSEEDLKSIEQSKTGKKSYSLPLLTVEGLPGACPNSQNLGNIQVRTKTKSKGCKQLKTSTVADSKTLSATFKIDTSRCNLWWIILASVLGGLLLIGIVIVALLSIFVPAVRYKLRPFSRKRSAAKPA